MSSDATFGVRPRRDGGSNHPVATTRLLAWVLPTAAALGPSLPGIGPIFAFRLLVVVVALVALAYPTNRQRLGITQPLSLLAAFWVANGIVLSLFAIDRTAALRTMMAVSLGLLLSMSVVRIARTERRIADWLARGWLLSFLVTGAIAAWELRTGQHLTNYFLAPSAGERPLPAATFYNPNAFAVYLVGVQAILLRTLIRTRRASMRIVLIAGSAACVFIILATGSRFCLAAVALLLLGVLMFDQISMARSLLVITVSGCLIWLVAPHAVLAIETVIPDDVRTTSAEQIRSSLNRADTSEGVRVELTKASVWLLGVSGGLGVGPGNFSAALVEYDAPFETGETAAPHNLLGELASEFGLAVFLAVLLFVSSLVRRVIRTNSTDRAVLLGTGLALVPAGLANSSYLLSSNLWALFATLLCFVVLGESAAYGQVEK